MKKLTEAFDKLDIPYNDKMIEQYRIYMDGILKWNGKINLTAITDHDEFIAKHFIDSVLCFNLPEYSEAGKIIDLGTGGGFPGIPLAILSPEKDFILADSLNKRLKVIDNLMESAEIKNASTIHGRAEELGKNREYRESFDICISRAVANLSVLAEYCLPLVKKGGYMFAYKGPGAGEELKAAERAIKTMGGAAERVDPVYVDDFRHNIVVIKKIKNTPGKYPRKAGTPAREPIE